MVKGKSMRELLRSNEPVFLSWIDALLRAEDIEPFVFDGHMSVLEGSAGAILRRVMVADEDYDRARSVIESAGEGERLV
ncbi:MAG: DUF2007 domain-containing protein [Rhodospirillaceae bacterium]